MAAASQQFLAAQQQAQNAAYAAQQATSYVINPGQEAAPYMGMIAAAQMPYYGVAPWGMYPGNLIPQQGTQPRRPLTPSQQGAENQPYQVRYIARTLSSIPHTSRRVNVAHNEAFIVCTYIAALVAPYDGAVHMTGVN